MICNNPKEFLFEIKRYMEMEDISIKDLAIRIGKSQQNASKILSSQNPELKSIFIICDALNTQMDVNFIKKDDTK